MATAEVVSVTTALHEQTPTEELSKTQETKKEDEPVAPNVETVAEELKEATSDVNPEEPELPKVEESPKVETEEVVEDAKDVDEEKVAEKKIENEVVASEPRVEETVGTTKESDLGPEVPIEETTIAEEDEVSKESQIETGEE